MSCLIVSPSLLSSSSYLAQISNFAQAEFQPGEFVSYSAGAWGTDPSAGDAAELLSTSFDFVYVNGYVEIGIPGTAGFSLVFTSAQSILAYQPSGGGASTLTFDLVNPTTTASGVFGGYVLALQNNVDFSDAAFLGRPAGMTFGDLIVHALDAPYPLSLNGLTIRQLLAEANLALGGGSGSYTVDDLAPLIDEISKAFEGGQPSQFAQDHLCIVPEPMSGAIALLGILGLAASRSTSRGSYRREVIRAVAMSRKQVPASAGERQAVGCFFSDRLSRQRQSAQFMGGGI